MRFLILLIIFLPFSTMAEAQTDFQLIFGGNEEYAEIEVTEVMSADTIRLKNRTKIKLIGLRAPELPKFDENIERDKFGFIIKSKPDPLMPLEKRAFFFAQELLNGKKVRIEFDANQSEDFDQRTPGYVYLIDDNTFVNEVLLRQGYASLQIRPPNTKYADQLRDAYRYARQEKRGIHSE